MSNYSLALLEIEIGTRKNENNVWPALKFGFGVIRGSWNWVNPLS